MKNAEGIYKEYMERLIPGKMTLIILEKDDWTNNFAVIKTDRKKDTEGTFNDYTLYWIEPMKNRPQPIRAYSDLSKALSAFHLLRYEVAIYTEYPF